jgi:predicted FMN-binding regulatory protein PaiB
MWHVAGCTGQRRARRLDPWAVTDASTDCIERVVHGVFGASIAVAVLEGRWKLSQSHSAANRRSVIDGLAMSGDANVAAVSEAPR